MVRADQFCPNGAGDSMGGLHRDNLESLSTRTFAMARLKMVGLGGPLRAGAHCRAAVMPPTGCCGAARCTPNRSRATRR